MPTTIDTIIGLVDQHLFPIVLMVAAIYFLYVYRLGRRTEEAVEDKGILFAIRFWIGFHWKKLAAVGAVVFAISFELLRTAGWSILGLFHLDPIVITNLSAIALGVIHFFWTDVSPSVWIIVLAAALIFGLWAGDFWQPGHPREND